MFEDLTPSDPASASPAMAAPPATEAGVVPPAGPPAGPLPIEPASPLVPEPTREAVDQGSEEAREEELEGLDEELIEWKQALREDFEQWLASLDEIPEPDPAEENLDTGPDLYSFYEQFAAANAETRKAHRRTVEAMSQWGDTLARFEASLTPLRETVTQLAATQAPEGRLSRPHCLVLVEWLDRLARVTRAFASPPAQRRWWESTAAWKKAWEAQRQAVAIVLSHLEELLRREGVARIETLGERFDPTTMTAVAAEPDATRPAQTVLEEIVPGYRRQGELLRPAQVKVSRHP